MVEEIELDWMPLIWKRFMNGTTHMNAEQIGGYLLLIREQWFKKSLPPEHSKLLIIARLGTGKKAKENLTVILEKFKLKNGRYVNDTTQEIWTEQAAKYLVNKEKGKAGGDAKARNRKPISTPSRLEAQPSSTEERVKSKELNTEIHSHSNAREDFKHENTSHYSHDTVVQQTVESQRFIEESCMALKADAEEFKTYCANRLAEMKITGQSSKYSLGTVKGILLKDFSKEKSSKKNGHGFSQKGKPNIDRITSAADQVLSEYRSQLTGASDQE